MTHEDRTGTWHGGRAAGAAEGAGGHQGAAPRDPAGRPPHHLVVRDAEPADEPAVLALFEACGDWFTAATGLPSGPGDLQSLFYALPEGADPDGKRILLAEAGGAVVGVVDVVLHHPRPDTAAVGLFLVAPEARRTGLGTRLAGLLLERAADEGIRRVTATVPVGQPAGEAFVTALGGTLSAAAPVPAEVGNRRAGPRETGAVHRVEVRVAGR